MTESDFAPNVYYCHQCQFYHRHGDVCEGRPEAPDATALEMAINRLNIWAACFNCGKVSRLSNLKVCPRCFDSGMLMYLEPPVVLDAIKTKMDGALEAAVALYGKKTQV